MTEATEPREVTQQEKALLRQAVTQELITLDGLLSFATGQSDAVTKYRNMLNTYGDFSKVFDAIIKESQMLTSEYEGLATATDDESAKRTMYLDGFIRGINVIAVSLQTRIDSLEESLVLSVAPDHPEAEEVSAETGNSTTTPIKLTGHEAKAEETPKPGRLQRSRGVDPSVYVDTSSAMH